MMHVVGSAAASRRPRAGAGSPGGELSAGLDRRAGGLDVDRHPTRTVPGPGSTARSRLDRRVRGCRRVRSRCVPSGVGRAARRGHGGRGRGGAGRQAGPAGSQPAAPARPDRAPDRARAAGRVRLRGHRHEDPGRADDAAAARRVRRVRTRTAAGTLPRRRLPAGPGRRVRRLHSSVRVSAGARPLRRSRCRAGHRPTPGRVHPGDVPAARARPGPADAGDQGPELRRAPVGQRQALDQGHAVSLGPRGRTNHRGRGVALARPTGRDPTDPHRRRARRLDGLETRHRQTLAPPHRLPARRPSPHAVRPLLPWQDRWPR
jgi:hypothetical protein